MSSSSPPNHYIQGNLVTLQGEFRTLAGVLTDPTTVTCTVRDAAGAISTPSPQHQSTGVYTVSLDTTTVAIGPLWYGFKGVGTLQAVDQNVLYVDSLIP